ncbi:Hypothetical predicted protein [Podarcis lilfordi]|uniref:Uncharacterized protein n=1 Tax=Podarcis lilfordi TaxID=74358 RepID=A0AA35JU33_9SAUR|nr:Hypothetical predicted protein [Podarcis lilfordi]
MVEVDQTQQELETWSLEMALFDNIALTRVDPNLQEPQSSLQRGQHIGILKENLMHRYFQLLADCSGGGGLK